MLFLSNISVEFPLCVMLFNNMTENPGDVVVIVVVAVDVVAVALVVDGVGDALPG